MNNHTPNESGDWTRAAPLLDQASVMITVLNQQLQIAVKALEHIGAKAGTNRRDCCKFSVLAGYRIRHPRELAREALDQIRKVGGGA